MASTKTNIELDELDRNIAPERFINGKRYRIRRISNAVAERMDRYVAKSRLSQSEEPGMLMANMAGNRELVPKCLSLMLLGGLLNIHLFHWIHWRYLHNKLSPEEMCELLNEGLQINSIGFFLTSLGYLQTQSRMIAKMTTTDSTTILQELRSEAETQSSSSSTEA